MKTYVSIIALLFTWLISSNAQEILAPDSLIGTWKYKGPSTQAINDTIILFKGLPTDYSSELWTFKPYGNRLEITFKSESHETDKAAIIAKSTDNRWSYDSISNLLKIQRSDYIQFFSIISFQNKILKLKKVK